MNTKISIITVTYNAEDSLEETIESVISQEYNGLEYLIIDGGSTDGTLKIIKKYEKYITFWISEPDDGIYDAMNKGLRSAQGEWINFLNSGDQYYDNNIIMNISNEIDKGDVVLIYGDILLLDENGIPIRKLIAGRMNQTSLRKSMVACHQAIFMKKKYAVKYNIELKYNADYEWVLRSIYSRKNAKTVYIKMPFVKYKLGGYSDSDFKENFKEYRGIVKNYFGAIQSIRNLPHYSRLYIGHYIRKWLKVKTLRFWVNLDKINV